ncbi:hypothetical protein INT47_009642 [Mucor saturninus]|uniref:DUF7905 domain-containing protein n=1 Tax=Mucor saturninus TaxID=64648 RepID=A0A8H7QQD8_9FUNG|nr:hypothetical protein INT47_009642 [Mucor saturninus]
MSQKVQVPYVDDEDSSGDEGLTWRDTSLAQGVATAQRQPVRTFGTPPSSTTHLVSTTASPQRPTFQDVSTGSDYVHRNPDNYWVLPAHCNPRDILGNRYKSRSNEIQKATGSFIEFNERLNQIDIWGDNEAVDKAKSYLDMIVSRISEKDTSIQRKTQKWGKPDRELTPREKKRAEKRQARLDEEKAYQGLPAIAQSYFGVFPLPDESLPIVKLLGENESYLNQIRADCKAFLWYELPSNTIRIAADASESVNAASKRIRNWYIRCSRKPEGGTLRLMQQPKHELKISFEALPQGFLTYQYTDPERESMMMERHRILNSTSTGIVGQLNDLITLSEEHTPGQLSAVASTLNERNKVLIDQYLSRGLESMRLNDWNLRMKIRYGQICLIDYPKKDNQFMSIEMLSDKIFRKPLFKSALAPCISKTKSGLNSLFDYLGEHAVEFSDNPRTSFSISAKQYPTAPPPRISGQRDPPRGEMWDTVMEISFTDDGHRRLWNTMTDCNDLVDINCADLESHYSWDLRLQHARRLPNDDINSPHEKFSHALRVSSSNRLIMVTSNDYQPQIVTQKTKWRYSWNDYVVEICKDEIWNLNNVERKDHELPLDLTPTDPHRTLFKVSLYKEAWVNRLAENLDLKIGEAPSWTLRDFFASETEDTRTLMCTVKKFSDILNSLVPLYWKNAEQSLV